MKIRVKRSGVQTMQEQANYIENDKVKLDEWASPVFVIFFVLVIFLGAGLKYRTGFMTSRYNQQRDELAKVRESEQLVLNTTDSEVTADELAPEDKVVLMENGVVDLLKSHVQTMDQAPVKFDMEEMYNQNNDLAGWLTIDDTVIDYPVMQTPDDEEYYLERDFYGNYSAYGSLLMDTDSQIGSGTKENDYADGSIPCTNLIVHGHNMKNGSMFGNLDLYRKQAYEKEHNIIKFSSLYENREYEIISVFLSQVYLKTETDVFKYYNFFQANTKEEFDDFYKNIKKMALYETGVTAEFGDEFITLSVCAYHVENGRLVVVAKRIK